MNFDLVCENCKKEIGSINVSYYGYSDIEIDEVYCKECDEFLFTEKGTNYTFVQNAVFDQVFKGD